MRITAKQKNVGTKVKMESAKGLEQEDDEDLKNMIAEDMKRAKDQMEQLRELERVEAR